MIEKSAAGGSRDTAAAAAKSGVAVLPACAPAGAVGAKVAERPGFPHRRPPDKLSQPSTLSLKKSVRTIRLEVMPPCECPTNQKALMFSWPSCSMTKLTMLCKYSSSASDHARVGEFGVATTRRYLLT